MDFLSEWLLVSFLLLVALASPGPDFFMIVRNSLVFSRKTGFLTSVGLGCGAAMHVTYCIIGIAAVIAHSIVLFNILKYIGAAYLIYVGFKALRSKGFNSANDETISRHPDIAWYKAFGMGFLTNLLNPKATMFYLALFTQIINPHTPLTVQIIYGITSVAMTISWFSFVTFVLTNPRVKAKFLRFSQWIDRICGGAMLALGIRLALTKGAQAS